MCLRPYQLVIKTTDTIVQKFYIFEYMNSEELFEVDESDFDPSNNLHMCWKKDFAHME